MDVFANLALGFTTAVSPINLLYCFVGAVAGTLVGVLPGISPVNTVAMLLPFTFGMNPTSALIMLAGIFYGAQYGGSTSAILINVPGETSAVVTCLDGHQMARQGKAGKALGIAAIGSFFAGCVATLIIALVSTPLAAAGAEVQFPGVFQPDGPRADRRGRPVLGVGDEVFHHGGPGRLDRPGGDRRELRLLPAHLRADGAGRRHGFRAPRGRALRHRRGDRQPRNHLRQDHPQGKNKGPAPVLAGNMANAFRRSCAAPRSAARSGSCPAAVRRCPRSRRTPSRRRYRSIPSGSEPAKSAGSRAPSPRTTPAPRRASSPCSRWGSRPTPSWRS